MHTFSAGCGGDLTKEYDTFRATGYDAYNSNGQRCEWKVQVAQERKIILVFDNLFLYNYVNCSGENIKVMISHLAFPVGKISSC